MQSVPGRVRLYKIRKQTGSEVRRPSFNVRVRNIHTRVFAMHFTVWVVLLLVLPQQWYAMKLMTGGKSHIEVEKEAAAAAAAAGVTPKASVPAVRLTSPKSRTPKQKPRLAQRSVSQNDLEFSPDRAQNSPPTMGKIEVPGVPQEVDPYPSMFARLLASLSATLRKSLGLDIPSRGSQDKTVELAHGDITNRRRRRQLPGGDHSTLPRPNGSNCEPVEPAACRDVPFDAMVPHDDKIFAFKKGRIHILASNGTVIPHDDPSESDQLFPAIPDNVTAALRMRDFIYVFLGSTYMKFRPVRRPIFPPPIAVATGFHGVPSPVNGAFQLNSHTYVIISGPSFVFYQPDADPPVNPKFSPNLLANIFGGPENVSTAFNTPDGRRFLASTGLLYELNDKMQVIKVQPFKKRSDGAGWLDCTPVVPSDGCRRTKLLLPLFDNDAKDPIQQAPLQNGTIHFASGTRLVIGSPTPFFGPPQPERIANATFHLFTPGKFDMRSLANFSTSHAGPLGNNSRHHAVQISRLEASPNLTASISTPATAILPSKGNNSSTSRKPGKTHSHRPGALPSLPAVHNHAGEHPDGDDHGDEGSLQPSRGIHGKISREDVPRASGAVLAKQLEAQSLVLKELMDKLKNLTQAISSIPRPLT
ncbi:hypothetical protein BV898_10887 [Hypsibius exemplaris]|uniref:Uncharacterized protein n=1 Tax=Hypsibius exemplaris TaxID=2072580 RepID=A0A1W0WII0_HYPEX|nr:hypothetical protein BV898_10887 [Hypsibius exemplaris]